MSPAQRGGYAACVTRRDGLPERQREKIIMRIPQQVAERVKEAPAQALRAVFSGIGQVLLVADRVKSRVAEPERAQPPAAAPRAQPGSGQDAAKDETRRRSLDETGNVRLLSEEDQPPARSPQAPEPPAAQPGPAVAEAKTPAAEPGPAAAEAKAPAAEAKPAEPPAAHAEPTTAEPAAPDQAALPVPNYDDLTLASLRARLRNLDQPQVRTLLDYEKAHAGRPDVLTMFERRIAKLESGGA
jgi:hypothetical protein